MSTATCARATTSCCSVSRTARASALTRSPELPTPSSGRSSPRYPTASRELRWFGDRLIERVRHRSSCGSPLPSASMPEAKQATKTDAQLRADALAVLEQNRRGHYTVPAVGLYPYQWCWDTG